MNARLKQLLNNLRETFWVVPGLMVLAGALGALALVSVDRRGLVPQSLLEGAWLYNGGGTGARTLLGVVASSTIGVAGTVFTITIAALTLAAGQMGPRLLRNFTKDRGNQVTLGAFLGTFAYALMVLRSVRTQAEGEFIPHLSLSVGILLALCCVGVLVYFVGHMASRINVDTVIQLVSDDIGSAIERLTTDKQQVDPPPAEYWRDATPVVQPRAGYLQHLDTNGLATWAGERETTIRLLVRPGDYVFPGAPIALMTASVEGVEGAINDAMALGSRRASSSDIVFAVRQLVEVAVRALSPGINDPHTAISALDRLGAALCELVPLHLPTGVHSHEGAVTLVVPSLDYDGLVDSMLHQIRQNAGGKPVVFMRLLEVLTAVASCEHDEARVGTLRRHADLVMTDAERDVPTVADREDVRRRYDAFGLMLTEGPLGCLTG